MFTRSRLAVAGAAGLLLAAPSVIAAPVTMPDYAVIENTGSTNTLGYMLRVAPKGAVLYRLGAAISPNTHLNIMKVVPTAQAKKLFSDLEAAMPLTDLPVRHGVRSASFGTQTYITYKGQKSPDLTFASDPRTVALKADIDSITKALHVGNAPRRPIVIHADR